MPSWTRRTQSFACKMTTQEYIAGEQPTLGVYHKEIKPASLPSVGESMTLEHIKAVIAENRKSDRPTYQGLDSSEIGEYNRALMFGDNDEAFPSQEEWSYIVD